MKLVELLRDYSAGGETYPAGTLAGVVKESALQIVLLFLDGKELVLSPQDVTAHNGPTAMSPL